MTRFPILRLLLVSLIQLGHAASTPSLGIVGGADGPTAIFLSVHPKDNLICNGSLELGEQQPAKWSPMDNLTSFWMNHGGNPGRCLKLDTTVLTTDKKQFNANPDAFRQKGRSKRKGGLYDNIGAHEGAWAFAPPVDLAPKDSYFILSADIKAPARAEVRIFIRGFKQVTAETAGQNNAWFHEHFQDGIGYSDVFGNQKQLRDSREGDYIQVYRHTLVARIRTPNAWETHQLGFKLPSIRRFRPDRLLIKVYAYWPSGIYYYDNITLIKATKAQIKAVNDARPSVMN